MGSQARVIKSASTFLNFKTGRKSCRGVFSSHTCFLFLLSNEENVVVGPKPTVLQKNHLLLKRHKFGLHEI